MLYIWVIPFSFAFGLYDLGALALCFEYKKGQRVRWSCHSEEGRLKVRGLMRGLELCCYLDTDDLLVQTQKCQNGAQGKSTWLHLGKFMTILQKWLNMHALQTRSHSSFSSSCHLRAGPYKISLSPWMQLTPTWVVWKYSVYLKPRRLVWEESRHS